MFFREEQKGRETAGCFVEFSLLTWGDMLRKLGVAIFPYNF